MGQPHAGWPRYAPAFGEVRLKERAMLAAELAERMQRLYHAGALRPATAGAGCQCHDGDFAVLEGLPATWREPLACVRVANPPGWRLGRSRNARLEACATREPRR